MAPHSRGLEELLENAEVLRAEDGYPGYDFSHARRAIARTAARSLCERAQQADPPCPPTAARSAHEQAEQDLRILCQLVVGEAHAPETLARLVNDPRVIDTDGARVYACVLALIGASPQETQYWWQFAAGDGCHIASYCLHLHHLARGELRDSRHWHRQAAHLAPRRTRHRPSEADDYVLAELLLAYAVAATATPPDTRALAAAHSGLPPCQDSAYGPFFPTPDPQPLIDSLTTH